MTAKEIFRILMNESLSPDTDGCDVLVSGDTHKEVRLAACCFKLTAALIDEAVRRGVDMIVTHEPTYSNGDVPTDDAVDQRKRARLEESGLVVYRFHDHAHDTAPDYIHEGFIRALGLKIAKRHERDYLGVSRYELEEEIGVMELALRAKEVFRLPAVRIAGMASTSVKSICLGLGWVGLGHVQLLTKTDCDLFITGEIDEVLTCEYVRDACYLGMKKSVILLGHYGAEYAGMRLIADHMNESIAPTIYLDSGIPLRTV